MNVSRRLPLLLLALLSFQQLSKPALAQDKPANPLQDFFRQADKEIKGKAEEIERAKQGRDQLDVRPPQRPEDQRRLQQALSLIENERWHDAVEILQYLLDQPQDAFLLNEYRDFIPAHEQFEELVRKLPEPGRRNYLNRFSPIAEDLLRQARDEQDEALLLEIARRFLVTPAGQAAQRDLCHRWNDRGEFVSAAQGWLKLRQFESDPSTRKKLASRAIALFAKAGQPALAETIVNREIANDRDSSGKQLRETLELQIPLNGEVTKGQTPYANAILPPLEEQLLIPRWKEQIVDRYSVVEQINRLISDFADQGGQRALVPVAQAIIVDGNIAYRSLRGLFVRDTTTGEVIWEHRQEDSPEQRLAPDSGDDDETAEIERITQYQSNMIEHHTLTSLLYRDAVYSGLTSSGSLLFTVRGGELMDIQARGYQWRRPQDNVDEGERERLSSNELVCYDLGATDLKNTPRWVLGGPRIEETFSRRLAGTFFFGPPVADGNELFVIGERDEEVLLFCLAAHSGDMLWSQPLCLPGRPIAEDLVRRFWHCLPVIEDGMVICPTGCGWLVGVDRQTHELAWNHRLAPRTRRPRRFRGFETQNLQSLNTRWAPSVPLVVDGKVLFTPPEFPDEFGNKAMLHCLDLYSGHTVWSQPKDDDLYLVGTYGQSAIVVTANAVEARSVQENGNIKHSVSLNRDLGPPSGRGVIAGNQLLLPLRRQLLVVDLKSFEITETLELNASVPDLGNLFAHEGDLFSLSSVDLLSFQSRQKAQQLAEVDQNPLRICLDDAGQLRANRKLQPALERLMTFQSQPEFQQLTPEDQALVTSLEWSLRIELITENLSVPLANLARLEALANTSERRFHLSRLRAEQLRESGDNWEAATQAYLSLLDQEEVFWIEEGDRKVRYDCWIGGKLAALYKALSDTEQLQMQELLLRRFSENDIELGADVLVFCDVGQELDLEVAKVAAQAGKITEALINFERAAEATSAQIQLEARLGFAEVCQRHELFADALTAFQQAQSIAKKSATLSLRDGRAIESIVTSGIVKCEAALMSQQSPSTTWEGDWQVVRHQSRSSRFHSASRSVEYPVHISGHPLEQITQLTAYMELQSRRLRLTGRNDGEPYWNFPLLTFKPAQQHQRIGLVCVGPLGFAVHRGVIHAMHMSEKAVRWTYSPKLTGVAASRLRHPGYSENTRFRTASQTIAVHRPEVERNHTGYLLAATARCVLLLERDLVALDPLTGKELWRQRDVSNRVNVHVVDNKFLVFGNETEHVFRRQLDGAILDEKPLGDRHQQCIDLQPQQMVLLESIETEPKVDEDVNSVEPQAVPAEPQAKVQIRIRGNAANTVQVRTVIQRPVGTAVNDSATLHVKAVSLDGDTEFWSHQIPGNSQFLKNESTLKWITPTGDFLRLDLQTGQLQQLGNITKELADAKKYYYLIDDAEREFLFVAHGSGSIPHVSINPSIRVYGTVLAYSKQGGLLWRRDTDEIGPIPPKMDDVETKQDEVPGAPVQEKEVTPQPPEEKPWQLALVAKDFEQSPIMLFVADRSHRDVLYHRRLQIVGLDKQTGERKLVWQRPTDGGGFSNFDVDLRDRALRISSYNQEIVIQPVLPNGNASESAQ